MLTGIDKLEAAHDGKLTALRYEADKTIHIEIETVAGARLSVLLTGVYLFAAQNFLEGNIILEAKASPSSAVTDDDIAYVVGLEGKERDKKQLLQAMTSRPLFLFSLAPSYGAEIACVCSGIAVT
jgi:hypothetical protein